MSLAEFRDTVAPVRESEIRVRVRAADDPEFVFSWLYRLCADEFGVIGHSTGQRPGEGNLHLCSDKFVYVELQGKRVIAFRTDDERVATRLSDLAETALERARGGHTGPNIWWTTTFESAAFGAVNLLNVQGVRILSEQRILAPEEGIDGFAYLATHVNYAGGISETPLVSGGELATTVTFKTPGPSHTMFAERQARRAAGIVRAYLSLATGLHFEDAPMLTFPAQASNLETAQQRLSSGIPELWFFADDRQRQVPMWPALANLGSEVELHQRIRGFLGCYEAAISQTSGSAAIAFLVAAVEALATPPTPWRKEKTVQRFVTFAANLAPDSLDRILRHQNFADVFGPKKSHRSFLDHLYDLRSLPFHGGLIPAAAHRVDNPDGMRVALASELARDALARFLDAPHSSLVGQPSTVSAETP